MFKSLGKTKHLLQLIDQSGVKEGEFRENKWWKGGGAAGEAAKGIGGFPVCRLGSWRVVRGRLVRAFLSPQGGGFLQNLADMAIDLHSSLLLRQLKNIAWTLP